MDISNLSAPYIISKFETDHSYHFTLHNSEIYIQDNNTLRIFEISDLENPIQVNSYKTIDYFNLAQLLDNELYAASYENGIKISALEDISEISINKYTFDIGTLSHKNYIMAKKNDYFFISGSGYMNY